MTVSCKRKARRVFSSDGGIAESEMYRQLDECSLKRWKSGFSSRVYSVIEYNNVASLKKLGGNIFLRMFDRRLKWRSNQWAAWGHRWMNGRSHNLFETHSSLWRCNSSKQSNEIKWKRLWVFEIVPSATLWIHSGSSASKTSSMMN